MPWIRTGSEDPVKTVFVRGDGLTCYVHGFNLMRPLGKDFLWGVFYPATDGEKIDLTYSGPRRSRPDVHNPKSVMVFWDRVLPER